MERARENLRAARELLESRFPGQVISLAYYAMRYAARAALSERDRYAKTHRGTWDLFQQTFVDTGRFDQRLLMEARSKQRDREASDYDAGQFSPEQGREIADLAARFLAAVEQMVGEEPTSA